MNFSEYWLYVEFLKLLDFLLTLAVFMTCVSPNDKSHTERNADITRHAHDSVDLLSRSSKPSFHMMEWGPKTLPLPDAGTVHYRH